jgi:hypothetical protein
VDGGKKIMKKLHGKLAFAVKDIRFGKDYRRLPWQ